MESLLVGVELPAKRRRLVEYAARQGADQAVLDSLRRLPKDEYELLSDVGEELQRVQPVESHETQLPREESGDPPGGERYTA